MCVASGKIGCLLERRRRGLHSALHFHEPVGHAWHLMKFARYLRLSQAFDQYAAVVTQAVKRCAQHERRR